MPIFDKYYKNMESDFSENEINNDLINNDLINIDKLIKKYKQIPLEKAISIDKEIIIKLPLKKRIKNYLKMKFNIPIN